MSSSYLRRTLKNIVIKGTIIEDTYFSIKKTETDAMEEDGDEPVTHIEDGNRSQEAIPEPENQVDLFIDDVLGQNLES